MYRYLLVVLIAFFSLSCSEKVTVDVSVKIGVLLPLTGSGASTGESMKAALEIARGEVNYKFASQGIDFKVGLLFEDTKTDSSLAKVALQSLYNQGIRIVIGPYSSSELLALKPFADSHDIVLISPSSVSANLALADDHIFRLVPSDICQVDALDKWFQYNSADIIVPLIRNDVWGNSLIGNLQNKLVMSGKYVAEPVYYTSTTSDFTQIAGDLAFQVSVLKTANPGSTISVFLASFGEGVSILKSASAYPAFDGINWVGSSAFALSSGLPTDLNAAQFAHNHSFACPVFGLDPSNESAWLPVRNRLQALLGRQPEMYALTAYDALFLAAETLQLTEANPSIEEIKNQMISVASGKTGITGPLTFNEAGDREFAIYDFWKINSVNSEYDWFLFARYFNSTGQLEMAE
jgi:branched-chain amino acid transport system substrate-binding protein